MNRLAIALLAGVALVSNGAAQGPACTQITDTLYNVGPSAPGPMNGAIDANQAYTAMIGGQTIIPGTARIVVKSGAFSWCAPQGNYTVTYRPTQPAPLSGNADSFTRHWAIPGFGGPYQLSSVPTGVVNVSGAAVAWVSGLTFAGVAPGDSTLINNAPCIVASIQSTTALTLQPPGCGSQEGVSFSDGPVERLTAPVPFPPTISGPAGAQGLPGLGPALPVVTGTYCLVVGAGPSYAWTNCSGSLSYTTWTSLGSITWTGLNGTWSSLFH